MGNRKRLTAQKRKAENQNSCIAHLRNCPISARKARLVADMIRGIEVSKALDMLRHSKKEISTNIEKLLLSAVANWQQKNEGERIEDAGLFIEAIWINDAPMMKRIKPAPQGRAHRIRKRANHITIKLGAKSVQVETLDQTKEESK